MDNGEIDLLDIYRVLREDWMWVVGITAGFAVASVITALVMTEVYRAEIVVAPATEGGDGGRAALARQFGGLAGLAGIDLGGLSGGADQLATPYLQSRALVEEFIERHDLVPVVLSRSHPDKSPTLWQATKEFMESVRSINVEPRTGLITISVEWTDAVTAAEWANGLVALANEKLRERALTETERNIAYLNEQIRHTTVVGIQQAMFNLIENEMKTVMLANARAEYAFAVVDPAVAPEERARPKRTLMVVLGTMLGGFVSLLLVGFRRLYRQLRARDTASP